MKKHLLIFTYLFLSCIFISSYAQNTIGNIYVTVVNDENEPVPYAALILKNSSDSTMVKGAIADSLGAAQFINIAYGEYFIQVSSVGLMRETTQLFELNDKLIELPNIRMTSSNTLDEVIITEDKPILERMIDRTILNVDATSATDALQILSMAPGITVNNQNITLRGKSGVLVLIDGKPTYMSGPELTSYLASLPSDILDKVEIMTNPPAKYDAMGNAGVINIITKKGKLTGLSINTSLSYWRGKYGSARNTLDFNYKVGKINLFGNYTLAKDNSFQDFDIVRNFKEGAIGKLQSVFLQNTFIQDNKDIINLYAGIDINLSDRTVLGAVVRNYNKMQESFTDNNTEILNPDRTIITNVNAPATTDINQNNFGLNLNFNHNFEGKNKFISTDLDFVEYNSHQNQFFNNQFTSSVDGSEDYSEQFQSKLPQEIKIYSAKVDYSQPLGEESKMELGAKTSYISTDNNAEYYNSPNDEWVQNFDLTNHFKYKENINAAYVNFNLKHKKWGYQTGFRLEQTITKGVQLVTNETFNRSYTNLFPTAYLTYDLDSVNTLSLSYGRRIGRPIYQDLNPFRFYYDKYTFEEGNTQLRPQYSNNFELTHAMWGGAVTTTAYYNKTTNIIQDVIGQDANTNETFLKKDNLSEFQSRGINISAEVPINKHHSFQLDINYRNDQLTGIIDGQKQTINIDPFNGFLAYVIKFGSEWQTVMGVWYDSKNIYGTFVQKSYKRSYFNIQKTFPNKKGSIMLIVNDIFQWENFEAVSGFNNVDLYLNNTWQSRYASLRLTYRLGVKSKERTRNSGIKNEADRIKNSDK